MIFSSSFQLGNQYIEYFAGVGNVTRQMRTAMYRAARFDILGFTPSDPSRTNYMDLTSPSGYAFLWSNQSYLKDFLFYVNGFFPPKARGDIYINR